MKKLSVILLAVILVLSFAACGGGNKNKIVGFWQIVDEENPNVEYGFGLEFRKDGTMLFGLTAENIAEYSDMTDKEVDEMLEGIGYLYKIKYKVKSDTVMEVTVSAFFGFAKESTEVTYSLDGDTLVFDGATYKRVKK